MLGQDVLLSYFCLGQQLSINFIGGEGLNFGLSLAIARKINPNYPKALGLLMSERYVSRTST